MKRYEDAVSRTKEPETVSLSDFLPKEADCADNAPTNTKVSASIMGELTTIRFTPFTLWKRHLPPYGIDVVIHAFDSAFTAATVRAVTLHTSDGIRTDLPMASWNRASTVPFTDALDPNQFKAVYPNATAREAWLMFKYDRPLPYGSNSTATLDVDLSLIKSDGTKQSWTSSWIFAPLHQESEFYWWEIIYYPLFVRHM